MIDRCALAMQEKIQELQRVIQHLVQVSVSLFSKAFYCSASVPPLENEKNDFQRPRSLLSLLVIPCPILPPGWGDGGDSQVTAELSLLSSLVIFDLSFERCAHWEQWGGLWQEGGRTDL